MAHQDRNQSTHNRNSAAPEQPAPLPTVGEPLDGRHYLDVTEEQQYAGKPSVTKEQEVALQPSPASTKDTDTSQK